MKRIAVAGCTLAIISVSVAAQEQFAAESIKRGAATFAQNCAPCHGTRMRDPDGAFDLRTFPHDQKDRFLTSVTKGKNSMPPFGGLFQPDEIEALWAYVVAGEKR